MKECRIFRSAFLLLLLLPAAASAALPGDKKLLGGRLGLGFTNQIVVAPDRTLPTLSSKYYLGDLTAVGMNVGFDTKSGDNALAFGLKAFKNVFLEPALIFYVGMGGAYVNRMGSKFQGMLFLGSEFFFDRLPSLGFSFEAGIRGDSTNGAFAMKTTGDTFLTAGMHFYL